MRKQLRLVLIVSGLLMLTLAGCTQAPPAPTATQPPTATAVSAPVSARPTLAASADAWDRVQSSGTLLVGASADYPPFEYYDQSHITGFDVELIQAIGKKLGVNVQIKDSAFDGLAGALQLGRLDLAISALSYTPERAAVLALSDPYMNGMAVALAASNSNVSQVQSVRDLAGHQVAVQSGSVYEKWARDNLVDAKIIQAGDLHAYPAVDQAIGALKSGQSDVFLLDAAPAKSFVDQGGFKIVAERINEQLYVVAMKRSSKQLLANVNKALDSLQADGTVAKLAAKYGLIPGSDLSTPLPLPTPVPDLALAPTPSCLNDVSWVQDLTLEDMGMTAPPPIQPGASFQKGWRLANSGTCAWGPGYALTFANGDQMAGSRVPVTGQVAPGLEYDFTANLVAPAKPGTYQGWWQMRAPDGKAFGERIYVGILVPAPGQ